MVTSPVGEWGCQTSRDPCIWDVLFGNFLPYSFFFSADWAAPAIPSATYYEQQEFALPS